MADVSDETVLAKTGKTRAQWVKTIDSFGGEGMSHKEIARKLYEDKLIASGWWCQQITVDYERAKGRRIKGQTANAGFEVGVQKMIERPAQKLWDFLTSDKGLKLWLGDIGIDEFKLDRGEEYVTRDGTAGQIRSVYPMQKLRLTWQPKGRDEPTTLQLYLDCNRNRPNRTNLQFHHEKLSGNAEREAMKKHWRTVLNKVAEAV